MDNQELLQWIRGIYHNTREQKSTNAEVEWERNIPEPDIDLTEDQMVWQGYIPSDRPQRTL